MRKKTQRKIIKNVLLAVFAVIYTVALIYSLHTAKIPEGTAFFRFIDVGQGDCTLLQTSDAAVLIDTGSAEFSDELLNKLNIYGVRELDCVILSHPHEDHIGASLALLRKYKVGRIVTVDMEENLEPYRKLMRMIGDMNITLEYVVSGDRFSISSFDFEVLAPITCNDDDPNENSVVTRVSYGGVTLMFTGDAGEIIEAQILEKYADGILACDILKVGHHGSFYSTSEAFLDAVDPKYAVASCGKDNEYNHPNDLTVRRIEEHGAEFFTTSQCGDVTFKTDGAVITYETENRNTVIKSTAP